MRGPLSAVGDNDSNDDAGDNLIDKHPDRDVFVPAHHSLKRLMVSWIAMSLISSVLIFFRSSFREETVRPRCRHGLERCLGFVSASMRTALTWSVLSIKPCIVSVIVIRYKLCMSSSCLNDDETPH